MLSEDSSKLKVTILFLYYLKIISLLISLFNGHISGRLDNHLLSNRTTTQARLHLIVQFPVLNVTNQPENGSVVLRQKEYVHCLKRNLNSPHVS